MTLDQVCELHAARELYSDALQGNIAYSGAETLAWLQTRFASFLQEIAFRQPAAGEGREDRRKKAAPVPASDERRPPMHPIELDGSERCVSFSTSYVSNGSSTSRPFWTSSGTSDLRDPLLRSVEAHPNLKAHPGPKTIFLQWRITP